MDDPNRIEWGKVVAGIGGAVLIAAAVLVAYMAGRRSDPPRPTVRPLGLVAAAPARPVAPALVPMSAPTPAAVPAPTVHAAAATPTDADIAARIVTLRGEDLIDELWIIDKLATSGVTFAALKRNAQRHVGEVAVFTGEVLEIQDLPQGGSFLRLGMHYGEDVLAVVTYVEPGEDVVQGRRVRAYGTLSGTFEYTSQAGWAISIPRMNAVAVVPSSIPRRAARTPR